MSEDNVQTVAVVMPVYNRLGLMLEAVKSVLAQTYVHWRLIIVDDGSDTFVSDYLADKNISDDRFLILRQDNAGVAAARNKALDYIESLGDIDFFAFIDSDDLWHPEKLSVQIDAMACGYDMVASRSQFIDDNVCYADLNHPQSLDLKIDERINAASHLLARGFDFTAASIMLAAKYISDFRYTSHKAGEDFQPFLYVLLKRAKLGVAAQPLYYERQLQGSLQRSQGAAYYGSVAQLDALTTLRGLADIAGLAHEVEMAKSVYILNALWGAREIMTGKELQAVAAKLIPEMPSFIMRVKARVKVLFYRLAQPRML